MQKNLRLCCNKLGTSAGMQLYVHNPPMPYALLIALLPITSILVSRLDGNTAIDFVPIFCQKQEE